jgi:hypothetical protein
MSIVTQSNKKIEIDIHAEYHKETYQKWILTKSQRLLKEIPRCTHQRGESQGVAALVYDGFYFLPFSQRNVKQTYIFIGECPHVIVGVMYDTYSTTCLIK